MASVGDELAQMRRSLSVEPLLGELDRLMRDSLHPAPDRFARPQRPIGTNDSPSSPSLRPALAGHAASEGEGPRRELRPCWETRYNFSFMPDEREWIKACLFVCMCLCDNTWMYMCCVGVYACESERGTTSVCVCVSSMCACVCPGTVGRPELV